MTRILTASGEEQSLRAMQDIFSIIHGTAASHTPQIIDVNNPYGIPPRTGDYCYYVDGVSSTTDVFSFAVPGSPTDIYMGFACWIVPTNQAPNTATCGPIMFPGVNSALRYNGSTQQLQAVYNGNTVIGSGSCPTGQWIYVEIHFIPNTVASGTFVVKVNGSTIINATGVRTAQNAGTVDTIWFTHHLNASSASNPIAFDDIVVNNTGGSAPNNTFPGQVRLFPARVRAAGTTQEMGRSGTDYGVNHAQIREAGSGIAYLESGTDNQTDEAFVDNVQLPVGASIVNVIVDAHVRSQTGSGHVTPLVRGSGADQLGSSVTVPTSWTSVQQAWNTNPDTGLAWTQSDLATLQVGVKNA